MRINRNNFIGFLLSAISCGIIIFIIEAQKSIIQVFLAFIILFPLISFFSAIRGKIAVYIVFSILIMVGYVCYKYELYDTIYGFILAILLGGAVSFFRVSKAKNFSPSQYKFKAKDEE